MAIVPYAWWSNRKPVDIVNGVLTSDVHPALVDNTKVAETRDTGQPHGNLHNIN